jgi:hypothetical protein
MAFTPQEKREHRMKASVRERERKYKREWDQENKQRRTQYMRDWRSGKVGGGSTTTPTTSSTTDATQVEMFDGDSS